MSTRTPREAAQGMARQAFDAGMQAASLPRAQRDRKRVQVMEYAGTVVAAHMEAQALPSDPLAARVAIAEQIAAVREQRDYLARSAEWRAGRGSYDPIRQERDLKRLDAAIATLDRLAGAIPVASEAARA